MRDSKVLLTLTLLTAMTIAITSCAYAVMVSRKVVSNVSTVRLIGVNVWWNQNRTDAVSFIDWGLLEPNETKTLQVYVESKSVVSQMLRIYASDWSPVAANVSDYVGFSAEPNNFVIEPSAVENVTLTLTIYANATDSEITTFGFNIVFEGSG